MRDWAEAFIAAALLVSLVVWVTREAVLLWRFYV